MARLRLWLLHPRGYVYRATCLCTSLVMGIWLLPALELKQRNLLPTLGNVSLGGHCSQFSGKYSSEWNFWVIGRHLLSFGETA